MPENQNDNPNALTPDDARIDQIRLFVTDVDGTLTDGGMYYTAEGEVMKLFNTRDASGMARLRRHGITLGIMTTEASEIVKVRARKLKIEHVFIGVEDKPALMLQFLDQLGLAWENLAYIGDDVNDLEVLRRAGLSACPADAASPVKDVCDHICTHSGGRGAVREFCDLIKPFTPEQP